MQVKNQAGVPVRKLTGGHSCPPGRGVVVMKPMFATFVGAVMALHKAEAAPSVDVTDAPSETLLVLKRVISSNMRFVFTLGLEGSGHHMVGEVLDHLFDTNENLLQISHQDDGVVEDLYTVNFSMGGNARYYGTQVRSARQQMRALAKRDATIPFPGTVAYPRDQHRFHSYPSGPGPNKALGYLDLRLLAEVAEEEGVDLRVLYLRRSVKDLIIANTVHRNFHTRLHNPEPSTREEKYMEYMQILFTDIAVMHSLLSELGSGFVVCHDFNRLGNVDQSAKISDFLAPTEDLATLLQQSFISVGGAPRAASNESLPYEGADEVAARLQRKFDSFESELSSGRKND